MKRWCSQLQTESSKYRHLVSPFLSGNGVDIGSGGIDPIVPWAIQVELPHQLFQTYNQRPLPNTVEWQGSGLDLPFKDSTLDFVFNSHLIEDFLDWTPLLAEWSRVLRPGGHLVIIGPEKSLWEAALAKGQPPNCAHKHEPVVGEIGAACKLVGIEPIMDELTNQFPGDYSLVYVGRKAWRPYDRV